MDFNEKVKDLKDFQFELQKALNTIQDHLTTQEVPLFIAMCAMVAIVDSYKRINPEDGKAIELFQDNINEAQAMMGPVTDEVH